MYEQIRNNQTLNRFDYFLILEDDVKIIGDMDTFINKLINGYLLEIDSKPIIYKDLDLIQLYSQNNGQCNGWRFTLNLSYKTMNKQLGLFKAVTSGVCKKLVYN